MGYKRNFSALVRVSLLSMLLLLGVWSRAQVVQRSEIGLGVGTLVYTGDLSHGYQFVSSGFAAALIYRINLSRAATLRASFTAGTVRASDSNTSNDALASKRAASFENFLGEGSLVAEYHFLDWYDSRRRLRFTPYVFGGLAVFGIADVANKRAEYSNVQFSIPMGVGLKYRINPSLYLALEAGYRQTFFDYLDDISGGNPSKKNYQYGDKQDYDGYFFTGLSLTYTFYKIPCAVSPYR